MDTIIKTSVVALIVAVIGAVTYTAVMLGNDMEQPVGALAGPDIPSEYLHWGAGAGTYVYTPRLAFAQATTTPCSIQAPVNGTSTLIYASFNVTLASTSILEIAKSDTRYATTTQIGDIYPITTALTEVVVASTTRGNPSGGAIDDETFGPGQWLVFKLGGAPTYLNGPTGFCAAQFNVI